MKKLILQFASKYRVCRRYSPLCGEWYVIQVRFMWHWFTLNCAFDELFIANQMIGYLEKEPTIKKETLCETPLSKDSYGNFIDKYPCKSNIISL